MKMTTQSMGFWIAIKGPAVQKINPELPPDEVREVRAHIRPEDIDGPVQPSTDYNCRFGWCASPFACSKAETAPRMIHLAPEGLTIGGRIGYEEARTFLSAATDPRKHECESGIG